jgi:hypothetical protein
VPPARAANLDAMSNPQVIEQYVDLVERIKGSGKGE